ncbi:MAG TPA: hypothetical protein VMX17_14250 [Candidatus Glassbacteria bacterium]|nr:hypothetical protein [Candidatus Glassbacteria bacterium]
MTEKLQTHVAFCIDESGSVSRIIKPLVEAYNQTVTDIRSSVLDEGQEASMTAMAFGDRVLKHRILYVGQQVQTVKPLSHNDFNPSGLTPLFDSVYRAIKKLEELDDGKPGTSFVVSTVTDGEENQSIDPGIPTTVREIEKKTATDRWTFTFLVPNGREDIFSSRFNIPRGNVQGWDTKTARGTKEAFVVSSAAYGQFFKQKSAAGVGKKMSSRSFYSNTSDLTVRTARSALSEITNQVMFLTAPKEYQIRNLIIDSGQPWIKGAAFYQLVKTEKKVQDYKMVALRVKTSGKVYCGQEARDMLGIGQAVGTVRLVPGDHGKFDVFIQSTSVNRKIPAGSEVMYWPKVGTQQK